MSEKTPVTVNRSALVYAVSSVAMVMSLSVMVMRSHQATTDTVLQLMRDRADVSEQQRELTAQRLRVLSDQANALRAELDALRGRTSMLEAKLINLEAKQ